MFSLCQDLQLHQNARQRKKGKQAEPLHPNHTLILYNAFFNQLINLLTDSVEMMKLTGRMIQITLPRLSSVWILSISVEKKNGINNSVDKVLCSEIW